MKTISQGWEATDTGWLLTIGIFVLVQWAAFRPANDNLYANEFEEFVHLKPSEMGDTLAGVFAALAFVWIIVTVFLQANELREQRIEFKKMNNTMDAEKFESMVFEFIGTHNELASSIEIDNPGGRPLRGRACFPFLYNELSKEYRERCKKHSERVALYYAYKTIWNTYGHILGHYYRNLYNAFRVLSSSNLRETHHAKLIRSQLSDHELILLFYNCNSPQGEKFKKYAIEFSLFDNLPSIKLLDHEHYKIVPGAFGDNPLYSPEGFRKWENDYLRRLEKIS